MDTSDIPVTKKPKHWALVAGVQNYQHLPPLKFVGNDIVRVCGLLEFGLDFDTQFRIDLNVWQFGALFDEILGNAGHGEHLVMYFAGHGITHKGEELLLFADADLGHIDSRTGMIPLADLKAKATRHGLDITIILDACRTPAGARGGSLPGADLGLVPLRESGLRAIGDSRIAGGNFTLVCSCSDGESAYEVERIEHGLFTAAMIDVLREAPADEITGELLNEARIEQIIDRMAELGESRWKQTPWMTSSEHPPADFEAYANEVRQQRAQEEAGSFRWRDLPMPRLSNGQKFPLMVEIPVDPQSEHAAQLPGRIFVARNPVTYIHYDAFCHDRKIPPRRIRHPKPLQAWEYPVTYVSWSEAQAFCDWLSRKSGRHCRLPTVTEWLYLHEQVISRVCGKELNLMRPGQQPRIRPTSESTSCVMGLCDFFGNVWEWLADTPPGQSVPAFRNPWKGADRFTRIAAGMAWDTQESDLHQRKFRLAKSHDRQANIGFRIAISPERQGT